MEQVFGNLGRVLEGAGAGFGDVVKFTTFLVRGEDLPGFSTKRREIFAGIYPDGGYPANTLVVIDRLPNTDWLLEVELRLEITPIHQFTTLDLALTLGYRADLLRIRLVGRKPDAAWWASSGGL